MSAKIHAQFKWEDLRFSPLKGVEMEHPEMMRVIDAARYCGVSRGTIYRWAKAGRVESDRQGHALEVSKKSLDEIRLPQTFVEQPASPEEQHEPEAAQHDVGAVTPSPSDLVRCLSSGGQRDVTFLWRNF